MTLSSKHKSILLGFDHSVCTSHAENTFHLESIVLGEDDRCRFIAARFNSINNFGIEMIVLGKAVENHVLDA